MQADQSSVVINPGDIAGAPTDRDLIKHLGRLQMDEAHATRSLIRREANRTVTRDRQCDGTSMGFITPPEICQNDSQETDETQQANLVHKSPQFK